MAGVRPKRRLARIGRPLLVLIALAGARCGAVASSVEDRAGSPDGGDSANGETGTPGQDGSSDRTQGDDRSAGNDAGPTDDLDGAPEDMRAGDTANADRTDARGAPDTRANPDADGSASADTRPEQDGSSGSDAATAEGGGVAPPECHDGRLSLDETDVDCGGSCPKCGPGQSCRIDGDCDCGRCIEGKCASPVCGDGIVCGAEACDDGFVTACGACNADCTGPGTGPGFCGDGKVCIDAGEACDDGHRTECGRCNADCTGPGTASVCGDGIVCEDTEFCDDNFNTDCGSCNATCTGLGTGKNCTDGVFCPDLEADTDCGSACGPGTCAAGDRCRDDNDCVTLRCAGPDARCASCGNGVLDPGEACDGSAGLPAGGGVGCIAALDVNGCTFDFSNVPQLYCEGACSWAGAAGCDQADADVFCRLKTGWSGSTATDFTVGVPMSAPGFGCFGASPSGTVVSLGAAPERGFAFPVIYDTGDLGVSYPSGGAIVAATCTTPSCGDGVRQPGEKCDGLAGLPDGPVACRPASDPRPCTYDFRDVTQLFCDDECSWGGDYGCDQFEADLFCKLKLGSASASATSFTTGPARDEPGFDCPEQGDGMNLGAMPDLGITLEVRYNGESLTRSHGRTADDAVIASVECRP